MTKALLLCALAMVAVAALWSIQERPARAARGAAAPAPGRPALVRLSRAQLCVTEGTLEDLPAGRIGISVPKMRTVVAATTPPIAEARFTYLGPTDKTAPLASGQVRRQIGLKLRAENGCNLVYVMWRIEPESQLVVSVKHNPGQRVHAECGARGYRNIKARRAVPVPAIVPGSSHVLMAQLQGEELQVLADGVLGGEALSFDGPVGMRTDNGRFEVEFYGSAQMTPAVATRLPASCTGPEE
jgi:hypothetical protein